MNTSGIQYRQYNYQPNKTENTNKKATVAAAATTLAAGTATIGSMAYMAKTGKVDFKTLGEKVLGTAKRILKTPAQKVVSAAKFVGAKVMGFVQPMIEGAKNAIGNFKSKFSVKNNPNVSQFVENMGTLKKRVVDMDIPKKIGTAFKNAKNWVKSQIGKKYVL